MSLRLLHLADLHLDTVVGGRTEAIRRRVRAALHAAFERAVERALDEEVHAVLIAGDAFDDALLSPETAELYRAALHRLATADITVAWCTGNHDPGARNVRARLGRATLLGLHDPARHGRPRIHVFRSHVARSVELTDRDGHVLGTLTSIGHKTDADGENLALKLARPEGARPAVAMLHTQVDDAPGAREHLRYAPCSTRDLNQAGFDYWALGHVHVRGPVAGTQAWYAGNPQGRNAKEAGSRGGLLVEVEAGEAPRVTPIECCALRFETLRLTALEEVEHVAQLGPLIAAAAANVEGLAGVDALLRIELSGPSPLAAALHRPEERDEAERALVLELGLVDCELRVDALTHPRDLADFYATPSALREAHRILATAVGNDALAGQLAELDLSPEAPAVGDAERGPYLRARLVGAADELLARAFRGARS